jgi:hypothetical protein
MALCYNSPRVLNILGFDRLVAYLARKANAARNGSLAVLATAPPSFLLVLQRFCTNMALWFELLLPRAIPAH